MSGQVSAPPPDHTWWSLTRLGLTAADFVDPGAKLSGAVTIGADGSVTATTLGSWAAAGQVAGTVDPGTDGIYAIRPAYCRDGTRVTGDCDTEIPLRIRFVGTAPVAADGIAFFLGVVDEGVLTGATVDAVVGVVDFTVAVGPRARAVALTNGTASALSIGGTRSASIVGLETRASKGGKGGGAAAALLLGLRNSGIDNSQAIVAGTAANPTAGVGSPGTGDVSIVAGWYRTDATVSASKTFSVLFEVGDISMTTY